MVTVLSGENTYTVLKFPRGWVCSCPDYQYRKYKIGAECKHITQVRIKLGV